MAEELTHEQRVERLSKRSQKYVMRNISGALEEAACIAHLAECAPPGIPEADKAYAAENAQTIARLAAKHLLAYLDGNFDEAVNFSTAARHYLDEAVKEIDRRKAAFLASVREEA